MPIMYGVRYGRWIVLALTATIGLAGCGQSQQQSGSAATDTVAATNCISTVMQATAFANTSDVDLAAAFAAQGHDGCPTDFMQQFSATGSAFQLVLAAQNELQAHLAKEADAQAASAASTLGDVWNGQPSGKTPLADWQARKAKLEEQLSDQRTAYQKAKANLIAIAARYDVYPEPPAADARVTDDTAVAAPVPAGNEQ